MSKHKELYGDEVVKPIPQDVIYSRYVAIEKRLNQVMSVSYEKRNNDLKSKLLKARRFWERLEEEQKDIE